MLELHYERPNSLEAATALLEQASGQAFVLAGGTDLLVRMKSDEFNPNLIVDIKEIESLRTIRESADQITIGAAVPCAALRENNTLCKEWPGVVEAANLIGSTQIQGRCTVAGNLCNASPAADSVPALVAADAKATIAGPDGTRTVPVQDVPVAPGRTSLGRAEIIEAIVLERRPPRTGDAYLRFIPRTEMDIAVVGVGVSLTLDDDGVVSHARVAVGAVAPTVLLVAQAADAIIGTKLDDATLDRLSDVCIEACQPIDDKRGTIEFRKKVSGVLAKRAARAAYHRAGGN